MPDLEDVFTKVGQEPADTGNEPAEDVKGEPQEPQTQTGEPAVQEEPKGTVTGKPEGQTVEKGEPASTQEPPAEPSKDDRLAWLSEKLGVKLEKEDQLNDYAKRLRGYEEVEAKAKQADTLQGQLEELKIKNDELTKQLDPLSYFASENDFKVQQLKKLYPDRNPYVLQEIVEKDLSKMDDVDVLVKAVMIDNPDLRGGEAGARDAVLGKYLEEGALLEEADDRTLNRIKIDANAARRQLRALTDVELPKIQTLEDRQKAQEEKVASIREGWKPYMEKIAAPDALEIKDAEGNKLFDFELEEGSTSGIADYLDAFVVAGELEPSEETLMTVIDQRDRDLVYDNLPKILAVYKNQLLSEFQKKVDEELNNTKPPNTAEPTDKEVQSAVSGFEKMAEEYLGKSRGRKTIG